MNTLPRTEQVLRDAVAARIFPGAIVEIGTRHGAVATLTAGTLSYERGSPAVDAGTIYDLASLTKVLCTTTLAARLVEAGALGLDDPVARWMPGWSNTDRLGVTVRHLLAHASGLPAYRRYFERWRGRDAFERAIVSEPLEYGPAQCSVYSDLGFMLLGFIVERAAGAALDVLFQSWLEAHTGPGTVLRFLPPAAWRVGIAPTEIDPWRGRLLVGEVHDENAFALGGVAAHAGLFGTAAATGACARWWMRMAVEAPVFSAFTRRGTVSGSSRALGWDTMLPTSSCGSRMSATAIGHTGFTGTSLWIDVEQDRYVVCLSNRVHPTRAGEAMTRLRPAIHDAVADDLSAG